MDKGYLVLETGDIYEGTWIGSQAKASGELVFNTSMTGYQEILTDPSYAGQIMTFCYPLIGNYGVNSLDNESAALHPEAVIISDLCTMPSHYLSIKGFSDHLESEGIPGLCGIDTRAIVKKIRKQGTMKAIISKTPDVQFDTSVDDATSLVQTVSTKQSYTIENDGLHVVLVDYGFKKSMLTALTDTGCKVTVVPYDTTFNKIKSLNPDGVMFSNGPDDPVKLAHLFKEVKAITKHYPSLGICLGHQMIALSYGSKTDKLLFGHRGANHPVKEVLTGKVWMTSQNHSYVVTEDSINEEIFTVTYRNVNDKSIEGLKHNHLPIETVQFHPEAHPGPDDTQHIFNRFIESMKACKGDRTNAITY
ncbi:carbamoyl phosphate synthase small subunit [Terrilactibacillus laevilacticus]|uniref:carbamoyl phosphate synthase small subunit n=1 Tax=Terrilactibacillus laevilacticus TaxID=1380157 RepID=UPI0011462021|nr:carbamoyl phosphate synthase small subunit [Terrilactibacillus laevilacticus]